MSPTAVFQQVPAPLLWSVGLLFVLCTLVFLQSTPVLGWMLP